MKGPTPHKQIYLNRLTVYAIIFFILSWIMITCNALLNRPLTSSTETAAETSKPDDTKLVICRITGSAQEAFLTYTASSGTIEQIGSASIPWVQSLDAKPGTFLSISPQNKGPGGRIKCEILVDEVVFKLAESSGAYVIAGCSGLLP